MGSSSKQNTVDNIDNIQIDCPDGGIADNFNNHFTSIADRLRDLLPQVLLDISKLENFVLSRKDPKERFSIPAVKNDFIIESLEKLNVNKATGVDKHGSKMSKIAAHIIAPSITKLMNISLDSGVFPQEWKTA